MEPVSELLLQIIELSFPRAVAGVVFCRKCRQRPDGGVQFIRAVFVHGQRHEVESAYEHIGPEPVHDVQNALVGAAAYNDKSAVLAQAQVLFVAKVVLYEVFAAQHEKISAVGGERAFLVVAGAEPQILVQHEQVVRRYDARI